MHFSDFSRSHNRNDQSTRMQNYWNGKYEKNKISQITDDRQGEKHEFSCNRLELFVGVKSTFWVEPRAVDCMVNFEATAAL